MTQAELLETNLKALTIFEANNTTLTVDSCAEFLKVHPNTIKNRIHDNLIEAEFIGGKYHIPKLQFLKRLIARFEE